MDNTDIIINAENAEELLAGAASFMELMMKYRCALREVETKFQVLNEEFRLRYERNPFETIKTRLKSPKSIIDKMHRRGIPLTVENIEKNLNDIAGIRVICSFPEDIYELERLITIQDDIIVVERKDYIANPKPNGYRSLHLILDIPIFLSNEKKHMRVEVQFRTIAMDFWASLEHKMKYKKTVKDSVYISNELADCAKLINEMDLRMQAIRKHIEENE